MAAINGGTFMLNRSVDEILFDADGKAWGIRGGNEVVIGLRKRIIIQINPNLKIKLD